MIQVRRLVVHTVPGGEVAYQTVGHELHIHVGAAAGAVRDQAEVRTVDLPEGESTWVLESQIVSYTE